MGVLDNEPQERIAKMWWENRRRKYNMGLVVAGILAFICYVITASIFIAPYDTEFEITLFTIGFQGVGYLAMIGIANFMYNLGYWADRKFNAVNDKKYRQRLFKAGYWFSVGLPFLVPVLVIVEYIVLYRK